MSFQFPIPHWIYCDALSGRSAEDLQAAINDLAAELEELLALQNTGDIEADDLTRLDEIDNEMSKLERLLTARRRLDEIANRRTSTGRRADREPRQQSGRAAAQATPGRVTVPAQVRNPEEERRHGFRSFGEFAAHVGFAYTGNETAATRLQNAATTYGTESIGGDGGYLVPPEFRADIWRKVMEDDNLLSRCAPFMTGRNSLTYPKDETSPWDNSAGIAAYWEGEGGTGTETKPRFEMMTARLNKLMALVKVTSELLEDAIGLDSYLRMQAPIKMRARVNTAVIRGTGVGQPLGIINAPSLITVSKETSQDASSILMPNINNMWNRLYAPCRANAVWLINQECEPQLEGMQFIPANEHGTATTASIVMPVYLPAGGLSDTPYARLKGRPVVPVQPCSALGTIGDIILVDLQQYMALTKGADVQTEVSMHLHFDQDIETYRFIFRVTGQPMWTSTISPENGSNTYSWAVVLETRS